MKLLVIFLVLNLFQRAVELNKIRARGNQECVDEDERIINGTVVKNIKEFPFVASLVIKKGSRHRLCGASIIAKFWTVTAAHCFDTITNKDTVRLNFNTTKLSKTIGHLVDKWYIHEQYKVSSDEDPDTGDYDVAVAHVFKAFPKKFVITIAPSKYKFIKTSTATVLGWGLTKNCDTSLSQDLRKVNVKLQDWKTCKAFYDNFHDEITKRMFCAGAMGKDACKGDSGGPIIQYSKGKRILIGVVSGGLKFCALSSFGVYTNLAVFKKWIDKTIKKRPKHSSRNKHHHSPC